MISYPEKDSIPIKAKFVTDVSGKEMPIALGYTANSALNDLTKGVVKLTVKDLDGNIVSTTLEGVTVSIDGLYMFALEDNKPWAVFTIKEGLASGHYRWFAQYAMDDGSGIRTLQATAYGEFIVESIPGKPSPIAT